MLTVAAKVKASEPFKRSPYEQVSELVSANATDLHVVWVGVNDVLTVDFSLPQKRQKEGIVEAAAGVSENVQRLFDKGVRRFLMMNLPPVGHAPITVATLDRKERHQLNAFSILFNHNLKQQLQRLKRNEPSIDICEFDVHLLYRRATAAPMILGLPAEVDATHAACPFAPAIPGPASDSPNGNPANHLYYDGLPPTAAFHALLGNEVFTFFRKTQLR